jgi:tricarballylate dehydrogenase
MIPQKTCDVVVVGHGIAGLSAALSAAENGAKAIVLEKAPKELRGGSTRLSGCQMSFPHEADEYCNLTTTEDEFYNQLISVSGGRANSELIQTLTLDGRDTIDWLTKYGVKWAQGYPFTSRYRIEVAGGGSVLVDTLSTALEKQGIEFMYDTQATKLLTDERRRVTGVRALGKEGFTDIYGRAVVLACGGFEASLEMKAKYIGPQADILITNGTRYNTGDGLVMAMEIGAQSAGQWSGYHGGLSDARVPPIEAGEAHMSMYRLCVMVNRNAERFIDEGADFHEAIMDSVGNAVLDQPGHVAFAIFDEKIKKIPRATYLIRSNVKLGYPPIEANSVGELAGKLGVDKEKLEKTIDEYNASVQQGNFNPSIRDGKCTKGITPPKSNWALTVEPPFTAYPVAPEIVFTIGGLKINTSSQVVDTRGYVMPGLYAAGEMIGELYYRQYAGGTSVLRGAVFGRIAGREAAKETSKSKS